MFKKIKYAFEDLVDWVRDLDPSLKVAFTVVIVVVITIILVMALVFKNSDNSSENGNETVSEENTESTTPDESPEATEPESNTESEASNQSAVAVSSVNIFFNGAMVQTYSKEDALNSQPIDLSSFSNGESILIQAIVGFNQDVSRIRVWTENETGGDNGDEYFLYSDNNWSTNMSLSDYSGTILIAISVSDNSVPPRQDNRYFKVKLSEFEESPTPTPTPTSTPTPTPTPTPVVEQQPATEQVGDTTNPQMFINTVAVTGYATLADAVSNPVLTSSKELNVSASNIDDDISRISIQLGNSEGNVVDIQCNPLIQSNNWSRTIDASDYEEDILVLYIDSEIGFAADHVSQFVAVEFQ